MRQAPSMSNGADLAKVQPDAGHKKRRNRTPRSDDHASIEPEPSADAIGPGEAGDYHRRLCAMRELMLHLHNPAPRASTFGFKEIYSPFVRQPSMFGEVFAQGVEFIRTLFPRAKFIFHARRNLSRAAASDFWHRERTLVNRSDRIAHFAKTVRRFGDYVVRHPHYTFATTLEGLTDRHNTTELEALFRFLNVRLTPRLRRVARSHMVLHDWVQERHTRRVELRAANGTLLHVERRQYAFAGR